MGIEGNLRFVQPGVPQQSEELTEEVVLLGETAEAMRDSVGALTDAEIATLQKAAELLIANPRLPEPDRKALSNWLAKLADVPRDPTQTSEIDLFDPHLISDMLANDPELVEEALMMLTESGTDPRVGDDEKAALEELAQFLTTLEGPDAEALQTALESKDPAEIANVLKNLLAQSNIEIDPDTYAAIEELLTTASKNIAVINIAHSFDDHMGVLTTSTSPETIYQSLWQCIDLSVIPAASREIVIAKLETLAQEIAQANTPPGNGIIEFQSMTPGAIQERLRQLINYHQMAEGPDKAAVDTALRDIGTSVANINTLQHSGPLLSVFMKAVPASNPYMSPGIMAMLAVVLSELAKVYTAIIIQSSELKQNMMGLVSAMASEAYSAAIHAGAARVAQLKVEVQQTYMEIACAAALIVATVAMTVGQAAYTRAQMKTYDAQNQTVFARDQNRLNTDPKIPRFDETNPSKWTASQTNQYNTNPNRTSFEGNTQRFSQTWNALQMQFSTIGQSLVKAVFTTQKEAFVMDEAAANAVKDLLNHLIQTVMDTLRSASEEGQRADKDLQSFNQLWREMSSTIANAIFRS